MAALALWLVVTVPGLGYRYAYEWDSVQLAWGAEQWSLPKMQPHPFGFPFWVLMLKALRPLMDPMLAQRFLSLAFTVAGLCVLWRLASAAAGPQAAPVIVALVAWAPPVRMLAVAQSTYTVDFFAGAVAGWLALRCWRGQGAAAFWLPAAIGAFSGVRSSTGTFLAPLGAVSLAVFLWKTRRWGAPLAGTLLGAGIAAGWFAAVVRNAGGLEQLHILSNSTFGYSLKLTSPFHGAPWWATERMMALSAIWVGLGLCGLLAPLLACLLLRKMWGARRDASSAPVETPWNSPWFYAAWAGPVLAAIFFVHGPKPGYQMLALPALAVAVSIPLIRTAMLVKLPGQQALGLVLAAGLSTAAAIPWLPYGRLIQRHQYWYEIFRAMPALHGEIDANMTALLALADRADSGTIVLMERSTFEAPNTRVLEYYRRTLPQAVPLREGYETLEGFSVFQGGQWRTMPALPEWVKKVAIVLHAYDPDWTLRAQYPLMRRVIKQDLMQVWLAPYR